MKVFEARYKNNATIRVSIKPAPKSWIEPLDIINVFMGSAKECGDAKQTWLMRPDEALTLAGLLTEAVHSYLLGQRRKKQ